MAESTKHGWKDEVVTIIVLAPCVMAWIDPELAKRGFDVISEMPDLVPRCRFRRHLSGHRFTRL